MSEIQNGTYIVRNAAQRSLVLAVNMGTIVQCVREADIDLSMDASGYSKFQREINFHYSPHSTGYCISLNNSPSKPSKIAFPYHIDGLPDAFMFFEEGHQFDNWRLICYGGDKFSIGLHGGQILTGQPGCQSWDLQKVSVITDLQMWTFERLEDLSTHISDRTEVSSIPPFPSSSTGTRHRSQGREAKLTEVKRRQAQVHLERQHRVSASELPQREGVMLTNVEKKYQLGSPDTDIENGTTPIVGVKSDWKNWTLEPIIEKRQLLNFAMKPRAATFRLIWNRQGGYVLGYKLPVQHGHTAMYMRQSANAGPRSNKTQDESWELRQTRNGSYIFAIPGTGLVLGVKDNAIQLEFARGLPTQEWTIG